MSAISKHAILLCLCVFLPVPAFAEGPVIVVNPDTFEQTVAMAEPGTTFVLNGGEYGVLVLSGIGGTASHPITLRSADSANPARFTEVHLSKTHDLVLEGLVFDYRFAPGDLSRFRPFTILHSSNVTIRRSLFDGDEARDISAEEDGYGYAFGLGIRWAEDVTIEQNEVRSFMRGFVISESSRITVRGNDLHDMRSDGMDFAQVQNVLIEDNLIRDFDRSEISKDHADMIQFWTSGTTAPTIDVVIRNNVLKAGAGWYTQSIFMRNELVDTGAAGPKMFYRNVTIEGNVIINAHAHGITVGETAGLSITNNTIIRGRGIKGTENPSGPWTPRINVAANSTDVSIQRNVMPAIAEFKPRPDWVVTDNFLIQDQRASLPGFYDAVFIAALTGDQSVLSSFRPLPGGPLDDTGLGAPRLNNLDTPAVLTPLIRVTQDQTALNRFTFDATLSAGAKGALGPEASFLWLFDGGQGVEGAVVSHIFAIPGYHDVHLQVIQADGQIGSAKAHIAVPSPDVLAFEAKTGQFISWANGAPQPISDIVAPPGPLQLGDLKMSIGPQAISDLFEAGDFDLSLRFRASGKNPAGEILRIHPSLIVQITPHGTVEARLNTEAGTPLLLSSPPLHIFAGDWHDIRLTYSSSTGFFVMEFDGRVVSRGRTSGLMPPRTNWGLTFGYPFKDGKSFSGELDRLELRANLERFAKAP